ncbi:MAG: hypothetical protein LBK58_03105 [Prevotellaceae bacterium]|nr:hypothetical protein [Prevotellaceae bacterium]
MKRVKFGNGRCASVVISNIRRTEVKPAMTNRVAKMQGTFSDGKSLPQYLQRTFSDGKSLPQYLQQTFSDGKSLPRYLQQTFSDRNGIAGK